MTAPIVLKNVAHHLAVVIADSCTVLFAAINMEDVWLEFGHNCRYRKLGSVSVWQYDTGTLKWFEASKGIV